jgi:hypothetical protein
MIGNDSDTTDEMAGGFFIKSSFQHMCGLITREHFISGKNLS